MSIDMRVRVAPQLLSCLKCVFDHRPPDPISGEAKDCSTA